MCRVDERVYVRSDGRESVFEETTRCHLAPPKRLCSNVRRSTKRYITPPPISRDNSNSPASNNPPTPPGSYLVQERRPSERRQSASHDKRREIVISIGGSRNKDKKYSTKHKRTSLASVTSNDIAIESPSSEASYTLRTGLPDTQISPNDHPSYSTREAVPLGHRPTLSGSSFTSSQTPSLVATSDPDSPTTRHRPRYPPTYVHNPPTTSGMPPPPPPPPHGSSRAHDAATAPSIPYRTTTVMPSNSSSGESFKTSKSAIDPFMYQDLPPPPPPRPAVDEVAPEILGRGSFRERARQAQADAERKKRQEEEDLELAKKAQREEQRKAEEFKQVRFDLARPKAREYERAQNRIAQSEKDRAEIREEQRRRKEKEAAEERERRREKEAREERERREKEARREEAKRDGARHRKTERQGDKTRERRSSRPPPLSGSNEPRQVRRPSISHEQRAVRDILLASEKRTIEQERDEADRIEQDERAAALIQQQQTTSYYNARAAPPAPVVINNEGPGMNRRNSVTGRRPSLSGGQRPTGLARTNSQRPSSVVIQPAPPAGLPPINTNLPVQSSQYSGVPASATRANPPTLIQPSKSNSGYIRPGSSSARTSMHTYENPFALPPGRISNTSQDTHDSGFSSFAPAPRVLDPWANNDSTEVVPTTSHARQPSDDRHTLRRRGEEILDRAALGGRTQHARAQRASQNLGKAVGFEDDYEDTSDEEANYGPRLGANKGHGPRKS